MPTKRRVLVVEDDDATRDVLHTVLTSDGFEVMVAPDGDQALRAVRASCPDAIVLDLGLPRLNGSEFVAVWRERDRQAWRTPVIVVSGLPGSRELALKLGAAAFIPKPVDFDDLVLAIHRATVGAGTTSASEGPR